MNCDSPTCPKQTVVQMVYVSTDADGNKLPVPYWKCPECGYRQYVFLEGSKS